MYTELNVLFKPGRFVVDFECAIHLALDDVWPFVPITGCAFHLGQSWYRKLQNLGLSVDYNENKNEVGIFTIYVFGIPFLTPEEIDDYFIFDLVYIYLVYTYISENAQLPPTM